jgi:hypothetical protein
VGQRVGRTALAAFVLLAGCAAPAPSEEAPPGPPAAGAFAWTGCHGGTVNVYGPSRLYPSSAPAGWEPAAEGVTTIRVGLLQCDRVSWGPFERGPVFIAQEWRDDFRAPDACRGDASELRFLLESIWFSDAELAEHARAAHGMPAHEGIFGVAAGAGGEEWTWGPRGETPSSLTFPERANAAGDRTDTLLRRLYWAEGDGVAALDLRYSSSGDSLDHGLAAGFLHPPTLYGRATPSPAFVSARAGLVHGVEATGQILHFEDVRCERLS